MLRTVLHLEDDPKAATIFFEHLKKLDPRIKYIHCPHKKSFEKNLHTIIDPSLIVSDLQIDLSNTTETFLDYLSNKNTIEKVPVIILSGAIDKFAMIKMKSMGVDRLISMVEKADFYMYTEDTVLNMLISAAEYYGSKGVEIDTHILYGEDEDDYTEVQVSDALGKKLYARGYTSILIHTFTFQHVKKIKELFLNSGITIDYCVLDKSGNAYSEINTIDHDLLLLNVRFMGHPEAQRIKVEYRSKKAREVLTYPDTICELYRFAGYEDCQLPPITS